MALRWMRDHHIVMIIIHPGMKGDLVSLIAVLLFTAVKSIYGKEEGFTPTKKEAAPRKDGSSLSWGA
jgi:hypothetical protein